MKRNGLELMERAKREEKELRSPLEQSINLL